MGSGEPEVMLLHEMSLEVSIKLPEVGLFDLPHEDSDFAGFEIELESDAAHAFPDEVDLDVEDVVAAPHGPCGVIVVIDWKQSFFHAPNAKFDGMELVILLKRDCGRTLFIQRKGHGLKA